MRALIKKDFEEAFQRVDDWRRIINQRIPANQTGEHHDDRNIENRANNQRRDDADGQIALRAIAFLRGRGYGVETNVSEKHDGAAGQNSGPAVGRERMPVGGLNKSRGEANEHENRDDFEEHHHVVRLRGLANPANQKNRKKHDDDECGPVKAEMPAGGVEHVAFEVGKSAGKVCRRNPAGIGVNAEPIQQIHDVLRKAHTYGHVADGIFENQVPADDPGDEFAHGGVSVSVGAARNRNHCCELGVANGCETARDGHQSKRERDRGPGAWTPKRGGMVNQVFQQRGIEDGRGLKFLASNRRADDGKDSRTDDRADAKRGQAQPSK